MVAIRHVGMFAHEMNCELEGQGRMLQHFEGLVYRFVEVNRITTVIQKFLQKLEGCVTYTFKKSEYAMRNNA